MAFAALSEIAEAFGLDTVDAREMRRKLRERLAALHPDRTGGQFATRETEQEFHRIDEAIGQIDRLSASTSALVPVDILPHLVRAVKEASLPSVRENREQLLETRLHGHLDRAVQEFRSPLGRPSIALTALSAVVTAVWAFPGLVREHPVLHRYVDVSSPIFAGFWLQLIVITCILWVFSWRQKDRHERLQRSLKTEPHQNALFHEFARELGPLRVFTKQDFIEFIRLRRRRENFHPLWRFLGAGPIDPETAQMVADLILIRLEQRGVIEPLSEKSLSARFRLAPDLIEGSGLTRG